MSATAPPTGTPGRARSLLGAARMMLPEIAPLLAFYALLAGFGLKAAIAGSIVFILADTVRHRVRRLGFSRIYIVSAVLTVGFGAIDLAVKTPFMLSYEAVITSLLTGAIFAAGALGRRPMLQEIAAQQAGEDFPDRPDITRFFRLLTLFWAAYFVAKALLYVWLARRHTVEGAMALRSVIGPVSLGVMFLVSMQGRRLFRLCARLGLLPAAPAEPGAA